MTFAIRRATTHDSAALGQLRDDMYRELGRNPDPGAPAFHESSAKAFANSIERGTCEAWIAISSDGAVIGSVAMLIYPRLPSPESPALQEGYLLNVYTHPDWRLRGIAAALVAESIARARELGMGRIRLHASEAGRRVYEQAGFQARLDEMELTIR